MASRPGVEHAIRAAAGPLLDFVGVDGADEVRQAFDDRARRPLRGYAGFRGRRVDFVGAAPGQAALVRPEGQVAGAPRYVDIAASADDGVGLDGDFLVVWIGEIEMAVEHAAHHPPVTAA